MKTNGDAIFGLPGAQVTVDTPDGVTKTMEDGCAPNSLTNASWADGGPFGGGFGAFTIHSHDGTGSASVIFPGNDYDRSNAGVTDPRANAKPSGRFRVE